MSGDNSVFRARLSPTFVNLKVNIKNNNKKLADLKNAEKNDRVGYAIGRAAKMLTFSKSNNSVPIIH